jgi:hypothetical protein
VKPFTKVKKLLEINRINATVFNKPCTLLSTSRVKCFNYAIIERTESLAGGQVVGDV